MPGDDDEVMDLGLQSDGKLVAAGYQGFSASDNYQHALVRYNTDGSLDTTFGTGGMVTTTLGAACWPWR